MSALNEKRLRVVLLVAAMTFLFGVDSPSVFAEPVRSRGRYSETGTGRLVKGTDGWEVRYNSSVRWEISVSGLPRKAFEWVDAEGCIAVQTTSVTPWGDNIYQTYNLEDDPRWRPGGSAFTLRLPYEDTDGNSTVMVVAGRLDRRTGTMSLTITSPRAGLLSAALLGNFDHADRFMQRTISEDPGWKLHLGCNDTVRISLDGTNKGRVDLKEVEQDGLPYIVGRVSVIAELGGVTESSELEVCWNNGRVCRSNLADAEGRPTEYNCRNSTACKEVGACQYDVAAASCQPETDRDCRASLACKRGGLCTPLNDCTDDDYCEMTPADAPNYCGASSPEDCSKSEACRREGRCLAQDGKCVAKLECPASIFCKEGGWCGSSERGCVRTEQGCRASKACLNFARCELVDGKCHASEQGCLLWKRCKTEGKCQLNVDNGAQEPCVAGTGVDGTGCLRDRTTIPPVINRAGAFFSSCFDAAAVKRPQIRVVLRWTILASGTVADAEVVSADDAGVAKCARDVLLPLVFPKDREGCNTKVTYPLVLQRKAATAD